MAGVKGSNRPERSSSRWQVREAGLGPQFATPRTSEYANPRETSASVKTMLLPPKGPDLPAKRPIVARGSKCAAVAFGFVLLVPGGFATSAAAPAVSVAAVPASTSDDLASAKQQLAAGSKDVDAADAAAAAEEAKLPGANQALADADVAVGVALAQKSAALAAQGAAEQAVVAAQEQVKAQREQVAAAQRAMDAIRTQIAVLAREAYIRGGQSTELLILLETKDPTQFAEQLVALKRVSRENLGLFEKAARLQAEVAARLAELKALEDAAADRAKEAANLAQAATDRANEEQTARGAAQSAKQRIAEVVASRQAGLEQAIATRKKLKALYESLQQKLIEESRPKNIPGTTTDSGTATVSGTGRSALEALAWGMNWLGSGGQYNGLCLGFVDDAYDPSGGRVGTAIAQWYRAKNAGFGHPGDRNPPVGAQVFWWSGVPARHIAIYAGGGMVLTTGANGGRVGLMSMEALDGWGPYIGWASAYYG